MCCNAFCINLKKKLLIKSEISIIIFCVMFTLTFLGGSFMAHSIIPVIPADK